MNRIKNTDDNDRRGFMKKLSAVGLGLGMTSLAFSENKLKMNPSENAKNTSTVDKTDGYFNVKDFGATGDGNTNDIVAIQNAVKECKNNQGGTIYFPKGNYISGTIWFHDNMTILIDTGAVILESFADGMEKAELQKDVFRPHLFCADGANNIALTGFGSIQGQGKRMNPNNSSEERGFRSGILFLKNCTNVKIRDVSVFDSDAWTFHLQGCKQVFIDSVSIKNDKMRRYGNDGIDINSCKYVHVSNCHIRTSDDCIVLKTKDPDFPDCENIVVYNCTLESMCSALKFGSETHGNFRDIIFSNCIIKDTSQGLSIFLVDGGTIERVTFSNITIQNVDEHWRTDVYPVLIHVSKRKSQSRIGKIFDLTLSNINIKSNYGIVIQGIEKGNIENLKIQNINFRVDDNKELTPRIMPYRGRAEGAVQTARNPYNWGIENEYNEAKYHPAYINVSHVSDLSLENIRIYMTEKAERDNERAGISLDGVDKALVMNYFIRSSKNTVKDLHTTDSELFKPYSLK